MQARHAGQPQGAGGAANAAGAGQKAAAPRPLHHTAAVAAAPLPPAMPKASANKGCWLDAFKARAGPKRRAAGPAGGGGKRLAFAGGEAAGAGDAAAAQQQEQHGAGVPAGLHAVLYKFNEGYTNAVKRPMKVGELLQ